MKNLLVFLAIVILTLCGCKKKEYQKTKDTSAEIAGAVNTDSSPQLSIDSLRVGDSAVLSKTLTLDYRKKIMLFSGLNKTLQDSLYKGELYKGEPSPSDYTKATAEKILLAQMKKYFDDTKRNQIDFMPQYRQTWNQNSEMKLLSNSNGYLTVQYSGYGYSGGAHGYAYENYKVVDVKNQNKLLLSDIMDVHTVDWNTVLLKNVGQKKDELFEPTSLSYTQNFYFDENKITFTYGPYEIAPYTAGIIYITVPFQQIATALKLQFKQRMGLKIE